MPFTTVIDGEYFEFWVRWDGTVMRTDVSEQRRNYDAGLWNYEALAVMKVDLKNYEREAVRREVFAAFPGRTDIGVRVLKQIRHHIVMLQRKSWEDVLPREIVLWADGIFMAASSPGDCMDNTRVARVGNTSQVRRYRSQYGNGCCGFEDFRRVGPDGRAYMLGYNFGH